MEREDKARAEELEFKKILLQTATFIAQKFENK
jgi:hypothetical protein